MTELPPVPSDPAALKAWVASLSRGELMAAIQQINHAAVGGGSAQFGEPGPDNRAIDLAPPPDQPSVLTLTIELRGSKPRIWRRLSLPGDLTLDQVHPLFQAAMGWTDSHLHRFSPGSGQVYSQPYFVTEYDEDEGDEGTREEGVRLDQVLRNPGDRLTYHYDFGDGWQHRVTLESLAPLTGDNREPRCLGGARACPPEDGGGISSHNELAAWLRAGAPAPEVPEPFEDADHAHSWLPEDYDPDAFDTAEATTTMRLWASGKHLPWHDLPEPLAELIQALHGQGWVTAAGWLAALGPREPVGLTEKDIARAARPWLAVLNAIGPGTKLTAAGYLPPALVEQIAQESGVSHWWIGRANREDLTWPVATLRETAQAVGLLRKAKGTLTPTARARAVTNNPRGLVTTVLIRLPQGKGFEAEAGWFTLLGRAAEISGADLDTGVAQILTDRGWRAQDTQGVSATDARRSSRPTFEVLEAMSGGHEALDQAMLTQLARATLFGLTKPR